MILLGAGAGLAPAPAAAHPFGPPPRATISAHDDVVRVDWEAEADDAAMVAARVGLVSEDIAPAYLEGDDSLIPDEATRRALLESPALTDYLLEHITVRQDGSECDARLVEPSDFLFDGVSTEHRCADTVTTVDVSVTLLHEEDERYRTFGIGDGLEPDLAAFTASSPTHTWSTVVEEGAARWPLGAGVTAAAAGVGGLGFLVSRRLVAR